MSAGVLDIGPEAMWFRVKGQPLCRLDGFPVLRRVLCCLAEARRNGEGPLTASVIGARLWKPVRVWPDVACARVYGAIHRLRARGLRDVLLSAAAGYELDPRWRVRVLDWQGRKLDV